MEWVTTAKNIKNGYAATDAIKDQKIWLNKTEMKIKYNKKILMEGELF